MTTLQEESIVYPSVDYLISDNNLCVGSWKDNIAFFFHKK